MNCPAESGGVSKLVCYLFYRSKLRGIKPYRFRIVLQMNRIIRVICETCGLNDQLCRSETNRLKRY